MAETRPIRFGTGHGRSSDPAKLLAGAVRAEELGYSTFALPDHFMMPFAPMVALQAVANVTTTLRLGQLVLAHDFRHPAVLAKELASLDVLSGGRVEIGIGAGWMGQEYAQAGIPFDRASVRIERLEEAIVVIRGLFGDEPFSFSGTHFTITELEGRPTPVQRPSPPIMVGGGGRKLLAVAARNADIIQVLPAPNDGGGRPPDPGAIAAASYRDKIDWIADQAGERFEHIELATLLLHLAITDDTERESGQFLAGYASRMAASERTVRPEELLASPVVAIGSLEEVCDKLLATRESLGFSYFTAPVGVRPESLAPVIARLAGS
jgi:probable F420-dependent oxidoreductase